jgi:hypothetical protein
MPLSFHGTPVLLKSVSARELSAATEAFVALIISADIAISLGGMFSTSVSRAVVSSGKGLLAAIDEALEYYS